MDEKQFTTGQEGSKPHPPFTETGKILCNICEELACCGELDPQALVNEDLSKIKAIALSIIALARTVTAENLRDIPDMDPWAQLEALATIIIEQEDRVRQNLDAFIMKVRTIKAQVQ